MLQDLTHSWKAFSASCWLSTAKSCQGLEEWVASWQKVRWIWQMRQNFVAQFIQLWKLWLCKRVVRHCCREELGPFCWTVPAAGMQLSVQLIDLLSILLRCNGFTGIQKAVVDQTGSRPPDSDDEFWCKFDFFKKCFGASRSNHWAGRCWLLYKIYFLPHNKIQLRNGSL